MSRCPHDGGFCHHGCQRHSGRTSDPPRQRFTGPEARARSVFNRIAADLKQGSVLLMDHRGGIQGYRWAPKELRL